MPLTVVCDLCLFGLCSNSPLQSIPWDMLEDSVDWCCQVFGDVRLLQIQYLNRSVLDLMLTGEEKTGCRSWGCRSCVWSVPGGRNTELLEGPPCLPVIKSPQQPPRSGHRQGEERQQSLWLFLVQINWCEEAETENPVATATTMACVYFREPVSTTVGKRMVFTGKGLLSIFHKES